MVNYTYRVDNKISRKRVNMKVNWNRKYTTIAVYALLVIAIAVLFVVFVFRFEEFSKKISWVGGVAAPIICGIAIAYILNPLMMYFERKFFRKLKEEPPPNENIVIQKLHNTSIGESAVVKQLEKHSAPMEKKIRRRKKIARVLSLIITYIVVIAVITGIVIAVAPSLGKSVVDLADQLPGYLEQVETWAKNMFENNPDIMKYLSKQFTTFEEFVTNIAAQIQPMNIIGNVSEGVLKFIGALLVGFKNVALGLIISIYLLYSKERMLAQAKKIFFAFFKNEHCERFFIGCGKCNSIFKQYIISNLIDSLIIFVFMLIGMYAMKMPYASLISVVCAITNLIPFFGPFLGAIPCGLLILLVDPIKVIWFGIFVLILQQIDGNVIKPLMFGETMGLPAIWVLISIIVGGGLFNIPGMLLGVPVFAVFYLMFAEFIAGKLKKKDLPEETVEYIKDINQFKEEFIIPKLAEETPVGAPRPQVKPPNKPVTNNSSQKPNTKSMAKTIKKK